MTKTAYSLLPDSTAPIQQTNEATYEQNHVIVRLSSCPTYRLISSLSTVSSIAPPTRVDNRGEHEQQTILRQASTKQYRRRSNNEQKHMINKMIKTIRETRRQQQAKQDDERQRTHETASKTRRTNGMIQRDDMSKQTIIRHRTIYRREYDYRREKQY